jgi:uncharacterized protein YndB with AHSA1/START domain
MEGTATKAAEFNFSRVVEGPRDLVFRLWTEREHLEGWFGPKGSPIRVHALSVQPGGMMHYSMQNPNGETWWGRWAFRDIVPGEKLVFIFSFSNSQGAVAPAPFSKDFPKEVLSTVTFMDEDLGRTRIVMHNSPINATQPEVEFFNKMISGMTQGWSGTFDQLDTYVAHHR